MGATGLNAHVEQLSSEAFCIAYKEDGVFRNSPLFRTFEEGWVELFRLSDRGVLIGEYEYVASELKEIFGLRAPWWRDQPPLLDQYQLPKEETESWTFGEFFWDLCSLVFFPITLIR